MKFMQEGLDNLGLRPERLTPQQEAILTEESHSGTRGTGLVLDETPVDTNDDALPRSLGSANASER